jgi:phospholipid-binding lipoprotein MlaA
MQKTALLCLLMLFAGCASIPSGKPDPRDPWERFNRASFKFNDALDRAIAKPVAKGYVKVTPRVVRTGISNVFNNLNTVTTIVNDTLQGKLGQAGRDSGRFLLNTTLGLGGLFDPATSAGLENNDEDFGQTLGKWGMGPGPYLVLPLLGPSTIRDAPARIVDPSWWFSEAVNPESLWWGIWGLEKVRTRANLFQSEGVLDAAAIDRYSFIRDAWLQRRRSQVYDGNPPRPKDDED